jgi:hypothetical protein
LCHLSRQEAAMRPSQYTISRDTVHAHAAQRVQFRSCARSGGWPEPFGPDGACVRAGLVP